MRGPATAPIPVASTQRDSRGCRRVREIQGRALALARDRRGSPDFHGGATLFPFVSALCLAPTRSVTRQQ